ncbi:MAG: PepSY domain-containing protein [Gammaproteobacteria bacterium]|nr:PepSY domain-containing protein [Gammaproteobacteria bacterium]
MNKLGTIAFGLILGTSASMAIAEQTTQPLPVITILQSLDQAGYNQIRNIEYDDGKYTVEVFGQQGQKLKFDINARNGVIPPLKDHKPYLTMLEVARKLHQAGYIHIDEITFDDNYYEIKAYDASNNPIKLNVNSTTGEISKD